MHGKAQRSGLELAVSPGISFSQTSSASAGISLDSVKAMNTARPQASYHLLWNAFIKRDLSVQFGLSLQNRIARRFREDLQFLDVIHPQVGQIFELSQAATKNVRYDYRYRYLSFPVNVMYNMTPTKLRNRFEHFAYLGLQPEFLMGHDLLVDLEGFSMRGQGRFVVNDTTIEARKINIGLSAGYRFVLPIDHSLNIALQPHIAFPLLSSGLQPVADRIYVLSVMFGLNYNF